MMANVSKVVPASVTQNTNVSCVLLSLLAAATLISGLPGRLAGTLDIPFIGVSVMLVMQCHSVTFIQLHHELRIFFGNSAMYAHSRHPMACGVCAALRTVIVYCG